MTYLFCKNNIHFWEAYLFFARFFKVRAKAKQADSNKSESQANDWSDKEHNAMMDEVESEMNKKGGLDQK